MTYAALLLLMIIIFLARFNFFRPRKKGIIVLLYHRIDDTPVHNSLDKFSISKKIFEKQIAFLKKHGFISILPDEIEKIKDSGSYKHKRYVIISFDDGYKDNLEAAKILKKHGMKGIFFISTAYIGRQLDASEMMNENDIKEIVSLGMAIGSHSYNHKKLSEISTKELNKELELSLNCLNKFYNIEDLAYPFGNYNDYVVSTLKHHGIKRAYIIGQKIYETDRYSPYKIPRAIIRKNTILLDFYLIITRGRSKF